MFCAKCGKEISDQAYICPHCGVLTHPERQAEPTAPPVNDDNGTGWAVLSFFVPLAGLIFFLIWRQERPKTAKLCGICALVSTIASAVLAILAVVFSVLFTAGILGAVIR